MLQSPTVSVVIPCFNDGVFLKDALGSLLNQIRPPTEVLIINDGSTQRRTLQVLQSLNHPGIRVIHQENRGLAGARNTGIRNAHCELIYFLDSDDSIAPECLATLAKLLDDQPNAVAAVSKIVLCGGAQDNMVWGEPPNEYVIRIRNQWGSGIMIRKQAVAENNLWYDESMRLGYEDWELHLRLVKSGKEILFCPEPLYHYRIRRRSLLSKTRQQHAQVVGYIESKHKEDYRYEKLIGIKRAHAPALLVSPDVAQHQELESWLASQTYRDWSFETHVRQRSVSPYCFVYASVDGLYRLPREALECALMSLECYPKTRHCLLAVRQGCPSLFATGTPVEGLDGHRYPVALITRGNTISMETDLTKVLRECELMIEFIDQNPRSVSQWDQSSVSFPSNTLMTSELGSATLRKRLRGAGKHVFGESFERACIQIYDHIYYQVLCSEEAFSLRDKIGSVLGPRVEHKVSSIVYGLFLSQSPKPEYCHFVNHYRLQRDHVPPFFVSPRDERIHILIATAWLIEGGVEQIIFELCRLLDPARFRVTIVTTLPSHHSWDDMARKIGALVYHLADFLKPADMSKGFLHFVVNHRVDCLFIFNSEAAYRAARDLKRMTPWLPIIDRVEAPDPGGGYPKLSAKVGKQFLDLRTVSHEKLADFMAAKYSLTRSALRVIYIGTNLQRIPKPLSDSVGQLHKLCRLSQEIPIVLFIGRFADQKRPEVFVRIVEKIFKIECDCEAHFAMVGDGYLFENVKELVVSKGLQNRLHLLGTHLNAIELLADATILMMPSAYEGVALVSYEAMGLGIPQVFADVGGQCELITPDTGILIQNGDGEEARYAKACLELLTDPNRREKMATAAKSRIQLHFSATNAAREYSLIFEELARDSRKRAAEHGNLRPPHISPIHLLSH